MRTRRSVFWLTLFLICTLPPGCKHSDHQHTEEVAQHPAERADSALAPGDLLFQDLDCGPLCDAIEAVTEGVHGMNFSHVGMVVRSGDTLAVIEAIGADVHLTSLADFHHRSAKNWTGRVLPVHRHLADRAAALALKHIGTPYDDAFLPDNNKLYCSELIGLAYEEANGSRVFDVPPMTFKDPATGSYFPAWVEYYTALGMEIPEGLAGCNPGGLSRSAVLLQ